MKKILTTSALALALACGVTTASARMGRHKQSPEHAAAVKKCQADYQAASTAAKGQKGKEHAAALSVARKSRTECLAAAPK